MIKNPRNLQVGDKVINVLRGNVFHVIKSTDGTYPLWITDRPEGSFHLEICLDGRNCYEDLNAMYVLPEVFKELGMNEPKEKIKFTRKIEWYKNNQFNNNVDFKDCELEADPYPFPNLIGKRGTLTFEED